MRKRMPAYLTLEFTLLLPALLVVYMALTETALFLYNRCLLRENAELLLLQTARDWEEGLWDDGGFQNRVSRLADHKYLFLQERSAECRQDGTVITVTVRGQMCNVFHALGLGEAYWALEAEASGTLLNRKEMMRMIRRIKTAAEETP